MDAATRRFFDKHLDEVLAALPDEVHRLFDDVPMIVEDYPSRHVLEEQGIDDRTHLCGLYSGIPLTKRSVLDSGVLSDSILIYREGILAQAIDRRGEVNEAELRRQIRITILHELGHHHGLTEDDLRELGYG